MDIFCPRCGEPCDSDELHQLKAEGVTYAMARKTFYDQSKGCGELFNGKPCKVNADSEMAQQSQTLRDLLGDDIDGIAAMHEDFGGLL